MKKILIVGILAFAMIASAGLVNATYVVNTNIDISNGYAFQGIAIDDYKYNVVAIGNFDVVADCVKPWELPESLEEIAIGDALGGTYDYLDYAFGVHGSGSINTIFAAADNGIYQFQQKVVGTTVAVAQITNIDDNTQDLLVATDGYMDWNETMVVDIDTNTGNVQSVGISQSAVMDAWGTEGQSFLYHNVNFESIDFTLYQYAASPDITWGFNFAYPIPPTP